MTTSSGNADPSARSLDAPAAVSFGEAFGFWLKLGFISFGGPAGQIAIMHRTWGGIVAGSLFVLPSLFILIALSWRC